jgi:hypothetical protein
LGPDWRLDKLPNLFETLMSQKKLLIEDGLAEPDITQLKSLLPKVSHLCNQLADYSIIPTIVQPDFNVSISATQRSTEQHAELIHLEEEARHQKFLQ